MRNGVNNEELLPAFSFAVYLDNVEINFSKVSNIAGSIEVETIVSGGSNDAPIVLKKPKKTPDMLVLEKGVCRRLKGTDRLPFKEGSRIGAITISVKKDGVIERTFCANNGIVVNRTFSALDAENSALWLVNLKIAHSGIAEAANK